VDVSIDACAVIDTGLLDLIASLCWWRASEDQASVETQPTWSERGVWDGLLISTGAPPGAELGPG